MSQVMICLYNLNYIHALTRPEPDARTQIITYNLNYIHISTRLEPNTKCFWLEYSLEMALENKLK